MTSTEERIHQALLVIDSKIEVLDGKVNLVARANRGELLDQIEAAVRKNPILGQIYLLLDGKRNQDTLVAELKKKGVKTSPAALSRWISKHLLAEHGMAELVPSSSAGKIYRKNKEFERALNLTSKVESWMTDIAKGTRSSKSGKL